MLDTKGFYDTDNVVQEATHGRCPCDTGIEKAARQMPFMIALRVKHCLDQDDDFKI